MDLVSLCNPPEQAAAKRLAVREGIMRQSPNLRRANFEALEAKDVARLFALYDREFFKGQLAGAAERATGRPLEFRVSPTMTRAGGKTYLHRRRQPDGKVRAWHEIAVAGRMLLMTFTRADRPVEVCGSVCRDRLEALMRIMEHEMIHLAEWVTYGKSLCSSRRFKEHAAGIFGHAGTKHDLVTPREHAAVHHGVRVGSVVSFDFDGRRLSGRVNRITRRATILVADPSGQRYTDGGRYRKYYVPLAGLKPA